MTDLIVAARQILKLIDLTMLDANANQHQVITLCRQAKSPIGNSASVCISPQFIPLVRATLERIGAPDIHVATVINFPQVQQKIEHTVAEARNALAAGIDEIEMVFPYQSLIDGNEKIGKEMVAACKKVCHGAGILLKVIIESGELKTPALIKRATELAITGGADFIQTSTGNPPINTSLEEAEIILNVIKEMRMGADIGFKVDGICSLGEARSYLALAERIMGRGWLESRHFRLGTSTLLSDLLRLLEYPTTDSLTESY